ncbi:dienelactone hydrolase family protein [Roseococcus pinisoli]|uniref:Dienelactone hydrolase family protein n=1 Tax=Roseococcus pinisoli TaxID=2835040 RepID=A0ABS5QI50_9PROT|nr:dienelactone hydrolase family protein [Roseococcus pinisoli]MBS7813026.1 dienelactone hydrolase family protein [Roseococcus pinisoli]
MAQIQIPAADGSGSFDCLVVEPKAPQDGAAPAARGVVVLLQEIFGVNSAMHALSEWVADMGFIALTPDLFWRQQRNVVLEPDQGQDQWEQAFKFMNGMDQEKAVADIAATIAHGRAIAGANGKVGTMGFCLGGRLAFKAATGTDADCNVSYYGVGLDGLVAEKPAFRGPLLMHIAEKDKFVPAEAQAKILEGVKANPKVRAHVYPGVDHAFARMGGHSWDGRAATIANGRTAEFLVKYVG